MSLKKISLCVFFIFYLILPEYFALEISGSLPLLTASRVILLVLIVCCLAQRKVSFKLNKGFLAYLFVLLMVNIFHVGGNTSAAIKAVFILIVEELLLYIVLKSLISSKEMVIMGLDLLVKSSAFVSVLGIFETIVGKNLFYYLETTNREMLQSNYVRLGMLRAEASFGHPVYFAVYLVCILPFAVYFYESTNKKRYMVIAILNIIALFFTGTRGAIVVLAIMVISVPIFKNGKIKNKYLKPIAAMVPLALLAMLMVPKIWTYVSGLVISLLESMGVVNAELSNFGVNAGGMDSRMQQFTALLWQKKQNALLWGLGSRANTYGAIKWINPTTGLWSNLSTIDIGYLGHVLCYGIVGLCGYLILYLTIWFRVWKKSDEKQRDNLYNAYKYFLVAYFSCLLTSTGMHNMFICLVILIYIYMDFDEKERSVK